MNIRIGQGVDIHPVSADPEREMILGGVHFEGPGLSGHSDADAAAHAVTDALLSAAGLGDIGEQFPDTDPELEGADSMKLLAKAVALLDGAGWKAVNVDCTIIADAPKIAPRKAEMQALLSAAVGAPVTVKGRRTEGIGSLGRGEAVVALAVALVESV
jgi:2-C-methyl-D-erythritol 2,4-cyclodiphosphate synthase